MDQHEYVKAVYEYYRENDIIPGDPNEGRWEEAHYPLPRGMGDEVILLKPEHHFIQGILQSEDVGRCCFYSGTAKSFLSTEFFKKIPMEFQLQLLDLYKKWTHDSTNKSGKVGGGVQGRKNAESGHLDKIRTKESTRKGGLVTGQKLSGPGGMNQVRTAEGCRKGGETQGALNVSSGHMDKMRTTESSSKGGRIQSKQRWRCLVTGKILPPGPLGMYQKARGINSALREQIHSDQS